MSTYFASPPQSVKNDASWWSQTTDLQGRNKRLYSAELTRHKMVPREGLEPTLLRISSVCLLPIGLSRRKGFKGYVGMESGALDRI